MKSRPILITYSILAGLGVLTSAAGLGDLIGVKAAFLLIIGREAVQVGLNFYTQSQVVPLADAGAYVNNNGKMVSGPAAGVSNGADVVIVPTNPRVSEEQIRAAKLIAADALGHQRK
jgi:hypothetical protein